MFILLPLIVWLFDTSVSSEISFERFSSAFSGQHRLPAWLVLQARRAGPDLGLPAPPDRRRVRHLYMDVAHAVSKEFGKTSALFTLALSIGLTLVLGAKLFGLY